MIRFQEMMTLTNKSDEFEQLFSEPPQYKKKKNVFKEFNICTFICKKNNF